MRPHPWSLWVQLVSEKRDNLQDYVGIIISSVVEKHQVVNLGPKHGLHTIKDILNSYTDVIAQVHVQKNVNSPSNCCIS